MTRRLISEISDQFTGFPLSSRDFAEGGDVSVIQLRDVDKDGITIDFDLKRTDRPINNPDKFVREGDVLFKSRGHFLDALALGHYPDKTIVTNGFIVLRPHAEVLPRYLAWVLNNSSFGRVTQQTHMIQSVSMRDLSEMSVPIPDLEKQQKVINISDEISNGEKLAEHYFMAAEEYLRASIFK